MELLPSAELDVMNTLWGSSLPMTTRQVVDELEETRGWKIQTVATLLTRLSKRGFVQTQRNRRQISYFPIVRREDYLAFEARDFAAKHKDFPLTGLVAAFADQSRITPDELEKLSQWLDEQMGEDTP